MATRDELIAALMGEDDPTKREPLDTRRVGAPLRRPTGSTAAYDIGAHGLEALKEAMMFPGKAMDQGITTEEAAPWGAEMALNMAGIGTPFAKPGTLGVAGGMPSSRARDPNMWHGISEVKLPRPVSEMTATHAPTQQIAEKTITPADLQGGLLLPALGDRSVAGSNLMGFNGFQFANPVPMQGGHGFMAANAPKGVAWASGDSVISRLANRTRELSEGGKPVYFPYTAMGERSVDFSHHMTGTLSEALKTSKVSRNAEREFNRAMKTEDADFGAVRNWPGVKSERLADFLISSPGDVRNKFAKTMDTAKFQGLGFPSVAEARYAVTDPRLLNAPTSAAGLSVAKLDPSGKVIRGASEHISYPVDLGGQYVGGLGRSIPRDVFYQDLIKAYESAGYPSFRHDYLLQRGLKGAPVAQPANQKWVDAVSGWIEKNPKEAMKYGLAGMTPAAAAAAVANSMEQQSQ